MSCIARRGLGCTRNSGGVRSSKPLAEPEVHRQELYGDVKESHKLYAEGMFAARRACEVEESKSVHLIGRRKVGQCASRDTAVIAAEWLGHHSVSSCGPHLCRMRGPPDEGPPSVRGGTPASHASPAPRTQLCLEARCNPSRRIVSYAHACQ